MLIRPARAEDADAIWQMLEPVFRAGDTYCMPRDIDRAAALAYWGDPPHQVFVAGDGDRMLGTAFLTPNQRGGGDHVCNCGFVTAPGAAGRGVARALLDHCLAAARAQGFRAMQFNFVVATNTRAVALWERAGFATVGRLPGAFRHPTDGYVDALVMYRAL